ncbi:MAG: hypothetical protein H8E61_07040, partial [Bacteroidetes bacterium]|nr:hypothetical protein [Bacteroidota bacterium]
YTILKEPSELDEKNLDEIKNPEVKSRNRNRNRKNFRKPKIKKQKLPSVNCSICGKVIDTIAQTIGGPAKDEFSHFDCAIRTLSENENLKSDQKICYIGNGDFAIIEYNKKNFSGGFSVVKRISYENQEMKTSVKKLVSDRKRTARI